MRAVLRHNKLFSRAACLGFLALLTNFASYSILSDHSAPVGNVLLVWAAKCFGILGVLVAGGVSLVPDVLFFTDPLYGFRWGAILFTIALTKKAHQHSFSFIWCTLLWVSVLFPLEFMFSGEAWSFAGSVSALIWGITLVLLAELTLLYPPLWSSITGVNRHTTLKALVVYGTTCFTACGLLTGALSSNPSIAVEGNALSLLALAGAIFIALPFAMRHFAESILSHCQDLVASEMLPGQRTPSFHRHSSERMKRRVALHHKEESPAAVAGNGMMPSGPESSSASKSAQGVCAVRPDGTITFANRSFRYLAKASVREVLGKNIFQIGMPQDMAQRLMDLVEHTLQKGPRSIECRLSDKDHSFRFLKVSSQHADANTLHSSETPDMVILTMSDITARRTVHETKLQQQKLASLGQIVRQVAHSFNNALTAISGQASLAQRSQDSGMIYHALDGIVQTSKSCGSMVQKLLLFADENASEWKTIHLNEYLSEQHQLLQNIAGASCPVQFQSATEEASILCDTNLFLQAITSVVLHSRRAYQQECGQISITLDRERIEEEAALVIEGAQPGNYARIRIEDQGAATSPGALANLLDPEKQSNGAQDGNMDLSIVFAIIKAHDGFLTAESSFQRGNSVSLYFPLVNQPEQRCASSAHKKAQDPARRPEVSKTGGNHEKILIVEDEDNLRGVLAHMLEQLGYEVTTCQNGEEVFLHSEPNEFDLVLVDMVMPKISGEEVISWLKERGQTNVLAMSGYGPAAKKRLAQVPLLSKPFDMDDLARTVRDYFEEEQDSLPHQS